MSETPNAEADGVNPSKILLLTSGATFMAFLDTTVVNIAFPALHDSFPATSLPNLSWIVSGFGIAFAALLTPAGRLADIIGRRQVFLASVAFFTLASVLCAAAPNFTTLLVARVLQGVGAAGMIPAALGLVLAEMPPAKRVEAVGIWGAAGSMAAAAGPSLGGVLIDLTNWRSVFLINLPIGGLILLGSLRAVPARPTQKQALPDPVGTLALALGLAGIVLGLTKGADWGWTEASTLGSIIGGVVLVLFALFRSRGHAAPAVQISLWQSRTFVMANVTSLLAGAALFSWLLAGPLYLTTFWGYSVLKAGLAVTPGALTSALAAIAVGKRVRVDKQPRVVIGALVVFGLVGVWMTAALGVDQKFLLLWLPAGLIGGAAFGAALTGLSTAAAMSVPPQFFAGGTALNTTARQVGGAIGVGAMAAIVTANTGTHALRYVFLFAALASFAAAVAGTGLLGIRKMLAAQMQAQAQAQAAAAKAAEAGAEEGSRA